MIEIAEIRDHVLGELMAEKIAVSALPREGESFELEGTSAAGRVTAVKHAILKDGSQKIVVWLRLGV